VIAAIDITLARSVFSYTPTVSLTDGLTAMVAAEHRASRKHELSRELR
jgi:hypothetical protein